MTHTAKAKESTPGKWSSAYGRSAPGHSARLSTELPEIVAPQRHIGRWISAVIVAALLVWVMYSAYTNPSIDHVAISNFVFSDAILKGLQTTLVLVVLAGVLSVVLGAVIALFRLSGNTS